MQRHQQLITGGGVVLLGFCAALPFRHAPPPRPSAAANLTSDLQLQRSAPDVGEASFGPSTGGRTHPSPTAPAPVAQTSRKLPFPNVFRSQQAVVDTAPAPRELTSQPSPTHTEIPRLAAAYQPRLETEVTRTWAPQPSRAGLANRHGRTAPAVRPDRTEGVMAPRTHRLRDGDSLSRLARRYLGSAERWPEILAANRHLLQDPELLPIDLEIIIPAAKNHVSAPIRPIASSNRGAGHFERSYVRPAIHTTSPTTPAPISNGWNRLSASSR